MSSKYRNNVIQYLKITYGEVLINNQPYELKLIDNLISFFEEVEEYERCSELLDIRNKRLDHEKNYLIKTI